jgi:hypothetical protein
VCLRVYDTYGIIPVVCVQKANYVVQITEVLAFKNSIRPLLNLYSNLDRMRYNRNAGYFLDYYVHLMPYHDLYIGRPPPRMLVVLSIVYDPTRLDLSSPTNSTILFPMSPQYPP